MLDLNDLHFRLPDTTKQKIVKYVGILCLIYEASNYLNPSSISLTLSLNHPGVCDLKDYELDYQEANNIIDYMYTSSNH